MQLIKSILLLCLFLLINTNLSYSQSDTLNSKEKIENSSVVLSKSPTGAIYRSLILPGWGQIYVESYWKAPIFFVAAGTLVYLIVDNQIKFSDYDNKLSAMSKSDPNYQITKLYKEHYRDIRDLSGLYLAGVYLLATVDAYVDAHLYDFQVSDDLTMNLKVNVLPFPFVNLQIKF